MYEECETNKQMIAQNAIQQLVQRVRWAFAVVERSGERAAGSMLLRDSAVRALFAYFTRDTEISRLPPVYQKAVGGAGAVAGLCQARRRMEAVTWNGCAAPSLKQPR